MNDEVQLVNFNGLICSPYAISIFNENTKNPVVLSVYFNLPLH